MQRLESAEALARLPVEKLAEQLAFDVFRHQEGDGAAAEGDGLLGLILDDDGAGAQLVEFFGVPDQDAVVGIALGKEKLGGALDPGGALANLVDFAFPATAQAGDDLVLACQGTPAVKAEGVDAQRLLRLFLRLPLFRFPTLGPARLRLPSLTLPAPDLSRLGLAPFAFAPTNLSPSDL